MRYTNLRLLLSLIQKISKYKIVHFKLKWFNSQMMRYFWLKLTSVWNLVWVLVHAHSVFYHTSEFFNQYACIMLTGRKISFIDWFKCSSQWGKVCVVFFVFLFFRIGNTYVFFKTKTFYILTVWKLVGRITSIESTIPGNCNQIWKTTKETGLAAETLGLDTLTAWGALLQKGTEVQLCCTAALTSSGPSDHSQHS